MANSRTDNDSDNEREYSICSFKKDLFFKSRPAENTLEDRSKSEADLLNNASASCHQYALSPAEEELLAACDKTHKDIKQKVTELGKLEKLTIKKSLALKYCVDTELAELIRNKISTEHNIACQIDRVKKLVEVTISQCKDTDSIQQLFKPFLKNDLSINSRRGTHDTDDKVIVTFRLRHRDDLIAGLKLNNERVNVPVSQRWL
jgi:hypothetical protein